MTRNEARQYRRHLNAVIETLPDEDALGVTDLFPVWTIKDYAIDDRVQYEGKLYRCVQSHTSQADWTPDITPALWTEISVEEWPEWRQPTGAQDAYNKGDKVSHNGLHWISAVNGNVWEPGTPGLWEEAE